MWQAIYDIDLISPLLLVFIPCVFPSPEYEPIAYGKGDGMSLLSLGYKGL